MQRGSRYVACMFPRAVRILRIRGVDVRLDPSWVVIALLVGWTFLHRFSDPERSVLVVVVMAVATSLGFFGSVLAHELGHAFEAGHRDLEVHGITLFLFGGVTEMDMHTHRPRDEFTVAAIGPWTSLVLASVFGLGAAALDWYLPALEEPALVLGLLGWINLFVALFNIIPGAPLDGGRVLRAGLWALTGDRERAKILAARAGQLVAMLVWAVGVWAWVDRRQLLAALWFGVIGLFMFAAAHVERRQALAARSGPPHDGDEAGDGELTGRRLQPSAPPVPEPDR